MLLYIQYTLLGYFGAFNIYPQGVFVKGKINNIPEIVYADAGCIRIQKRIWLKNRVFPSSAQQTMPAAAAIF